MWIVVTELITRYFSDSYTAARRNPRWRHVLEWEAFRLPKVKELFPNIILPGYGQWNDLIGFLLIRYQLL